jgi:hypothetical protein
MSNILDKEHVHSKVHMKFNKRTPEQLQEANKELSYFLAKKLYSVLAYAENIIDIVDEVKDSDKRLASMFYNYRNLAKKFQKSLLGGKSKQEHGFLNSIFQGGSEVDFNVYRDEVDKTIDYILSLDESHVNKVKLLRSFTMEEEFFALPYSSLRKIVNIAKENPSESTDAILDRFKAKQVERV